MCVFDGEWWCWGGSGVVGWSVGPRGVGVIV